MNRLYPLVAFTIVVVAFVGCSKNSNESSLNGRVTLDGSPIGPGILTFAPVDSMRNPTTGAVAENGNYSVQTNQTQGLPAGTYRVAVAVYQEDKNRKPGEWQAESPPLVHPEKYKSVETSGLEYEVESGKNTINIELKSE